MEYFFNPAFFKFRGQVICCILIAIVDVPSPLHRLRTKRVDYLFSVRNLLCNANLMSNKQENGQAGGNKVFIHHSFGTEIQKLKIVYYLELTKDHLSFMEASEVWLRGPIPNIPSLLQPVAHALVQSGEEVEKLMFGFPQEKLWIRPAGVASVGFHLQHFVGVLDRLFTYARGQSLTEDQMKYLKSEGEPPEPALTISEMVAQFKGQIKKSLAQLENTSEESLSHPPRWDEKNFLPLFLDCFFMRRSIRSGIQASCW